MEDEVSWSELQIGDIIHLKKGEIVPADIILLDSG
jgi:magnesium-transporting ATPase (P-type)